MRNAAVRRQFVSITQRHPVFDAMAVAVDFLHDGQKTHVKAQHRVLGMVDDPGDLLGVQPWVERMQHAATAADTEIKLEMAVAVPCQGGNTVALAYVPVVKRLGNLT